MQHSQATSIHKGAYIQSLDPGAVGAKVLWIDTSSGYVLKKRKDDDTDWDTIADFGGIGAVVTNLPQNIQFSGDISPAQITSSQNDYNPTGLSTASVLRLDTDASRNITGLAGGADGRVIIIHNVGANAIVLKDEDAGSSAANRFALNADVTLVADECAVLQYDSTSSRWRMVGGSRPTGLAPSGTAGGTLGGTYPNPTVNTDGATLETNSNALRVKDAGVTAAKLATNVKTTTLIFVIDGGGSAITTGVKGDLTVDFNCTIQQATLLADQSGSIVVDIWKDTYANYPPTVADTITASAKPTLSTAAKSQDGTLTGWTTSISAGDTLRFNVDSITTCQRVTVALKVVLT